MSPIAEPFTPPDTSMSGCPVDHTAYSRQKTARVPERPGAPIERDAAGTWHVRDFETARAILRGTDTAQAGFKAEMIESIPGTTNVPILYQEGKVHQQQRRQTARFFTPKTVSGDYRQLMERAADELIATLRRNGGADLSDLSRALAVRVASAVVGLTNSRLPGLDRRLDAFFDDSFGGDERGPRARARQLRMRLRMVAFYFLDVQPAIQARRRTPREDVISHLLTLNYNDAEILTECVTYAAAGMVTTREFISVAAWHLLEQPELRARYLAAEEDARQRMLHEILRLEPVVGHLYRRATADIALASQGEAVTIPRGDLLDLHIYAVNTEEAITGPHPFQICPARELRDERVAPAVMGFGDGHHRCPGSSIAMQETDIFLRRLLALDGLRMERPPAVRWNELVTGYELRDFRLALD